MRIIPRQYFPSDEYDGDLSDARHPAIGTLPTRTMTAIMLYIKPCSSLWKRLIALWEAENELEHERRRPAYLETKTDCSLCWKYTAGLESRIFNY